jgi:hypothetical protein
MSSKKTKLELTWINHFEIKNTRFEEFQPQRTQRTQRKDCFAAFQFFLLLCSL